MKNKAYNQDVFLKKQVWNIILQKSNIEVINLLTDDLNKIRYLKVCIKMDKKI